jgi:formate hydrogenlyase transcriptional activator
MNSLPVLDASAPPRVAVAHDVHEKIVDEAIEAVLSTVDLQTVLQRTGQLLNCRFGTTRVAILRVFGEAPGRAQIALVSDKRHPDSQAGAWLDLAGSAAGQAIAERRPVVVESIDAARPRFHEERWLGELGYGSLVSFPLVFEDQALGALNIAHPPAEGLLDCCFQVAKQVARLVAIALHNSLMVDEVRRLNQLLDRENTRLKEEIRQIKRETRYVAESAPMKTVLERLRLAAPSGSTVLIRGETGTGKEGLARLVHDLSPRFEGPFVTVNLGALPETLIESELFGHEKGAFTGASRRRPGKFEQAEGGTIFLDEVGDAPASVQVRLLRVLQEMEIQRVGATGAEKVDVRVVAATNRDLEAMVAAGTFRADLYYRLSVFPLHLPPLRDRREEIRPLVTYLLERNAALMHRRAPAIAPAAWAALEAYEWPGNVRELENTLQRALILSPGPELHLPELHVPEPPPAEPVPPMTDVPAADGAPGRFDDEVRLLIERALAATGGRVYGPKGAAALLGLKPTTLQGKMQKYGVSARPAA